VNPLADGSGLGAVFHGLMVATTLPAQNPQWLDTVQLETGCAAPIWATGQFRDVSQIRGLFAIGFRHGSPKESSTRIRGHPLNNYKQVG
jgi:hypothetical protein